MASLPVAKPGAVYTLTEGETGACGCCRIAIMFRDSLHAETYDGVSYWVLDNHDKPMKRRKLAKA